MRTQSVLLLLTALCATAAVAAADSSDVQTAPVASVPSLYIVQAKTVGAALRSVQSAGAEVQRELEIINAVAARLTPAQVVSLRADSGLRVFDDRSLGTRGLLNLLKFPTNSLSSSTATSPLVQSVTQTTTPVAPTAATPLISGITYPPVQSFSAQASLLDGGSVAASTWFHETNYPALIGADTLQAAGIKGNGVTIAVLDTGLWQDVSQNYGTRLLASIDVTNGGTGPVKGDPYGHGTHVTSIAASGAQSSSGGHLGIAPSANLVVVRAFDAEGAGRYTDVIAGVNWIVANRAKYGIRILNLSFGAPPQSYYWDDPLNQAVMAAWRAGIVVVVSAGNEGPEPMTIAVPGNVPYVITVGALTDGNTPHDATDDRLASFSSAGPTFEGFVKPEVVAPGGHIAAFMSSSSNLANKDTRSMDRGRSLFTMSGTSQAAAVVTGTVALMLQADPTLTPDAVKCRLLSSTRPAVTAQGKLAYSVFQQGAGLINAVAAVNGTAVDCANRGLDLDADLNGTAHFGGPANLDAGGNYVVMDMDGATWGSTLGSDGYTWSQGFAWTEGYAWSDGYTWSRGYTWSKGYTWSQGYTWSKGFTWSNGYTWSRSLSWWHTPSGGVATSSAASIASWVPNE